MKNKTIATWLAFLGGSLGFHRFYLFGVRDYLAWLIPLPTLLGLYGLLRLRQYGVDDQVSWVLLPLLGFCLAAAALTAIVYGLMTPAKWNARFNPRFALDAAAGQTRGITVAAVILSLLIGCTALLSGIAMGFQHYFEYQIEEGRKISQ